MSAFGGIVALNRPCDTALARLLVERFYEVVTAPAFTEGARQILARKRRLRLVEGDPVKLAAAGVESYRSTALGLLIQSKDPPIRSEDPESWRVVTRVSPSDEQMAALRFLWKVCKHVRSNAIVIGSAQRTFGIGAGQMSRVDAVEIAIDKSTGGDQPACLASDAFFPFRDSIDRAAQAGIVAVVQPGGSRRDNEVIEAADVHGIPMVFTGRRHFRH
jgi:phosphoribosylaminoimidazolecarboxamide formyltransferase/IMP cyclohydrolase